MIFRLYFVSVNTLFAEIKLPNIPELYSGPIVFRDLYVSQSETPAGRTFQNR